jgi:hypothetical protein
VVTPSPSTTTTIVVVPATTSGLDGCSGSNPNAIACYFQ